MMVLINGVLQSRLRFNGERRDDICCLPLHIGDETWSFGVRYSFRLGGFLMQTHLHHHILPSCDIMMLAESSVVVGENDPVCLGTMKVRTAFTVRNLN